MPKVSKRETQANNDFANALRECLGLAPLYQDQRSEKRRDDTARFYGGVWSWDRPGYIHGRRVAPRNK